MIWGNTHITFFFNLSIFLSRQSPSHCCSFCHMCGADPEEGWLEVAQADGSRPRADCAGPSCRSHLFLLQQASWEIYLFQNKGTEIMHRRNVNVCVFAAIWTAAQIQTSGVRFSEPPRLVSTSSGQSQSTPRILPYRGCDFSGGGQTDAYVETILTCILEVTVLRAGAFSHCRHHRGTCP